MQPTIQQPRTAQNRVSASQRSTRSATPQQPGSDDDPGEIPALTRTRARELVALLPGRAALLDPCGIVIAWNDHSSPAGGYESPRPPSEIGLLVTPLKNAGGLTLLWEPEVTVRPGGGKNASVALTVSRAQIGDLTCRLMRAQEDERKKIARELHDDLGQRLAAHALAIGNLKQHLDKDPAVLKERLQALETDAVELGDAIRMVSHELHPALLERFGLAQALRTFAADFCEWSGLRLVADIQNPPEPPSDLIAIATYRIVQEALRNIERHAHATTVHLKLTFTPHQLHLLIEDNGIGFTRDNASAKKGLGLTSIDERVRLLNGRLSIEGARGHGTALTVRIPFHPTSP